MINVNSLEIHASYHCNLSCRYCMHMSPLEHKHFIAKEELEEDLGYLKGIISAEEIRLLGGEPLLNHELAALAKVIRKSEIGGQLSISTNGILLNRWRDSGELWEIIDKCEVSIYDVEWIDKEAIISNCNYISEKYGVAFHLYYYDSFRQPGTFDKCNDTVMTKKIFESCIIAHTWQCYNIFEGRFYLCPQAIGFSRNNPNVDIGDSSVSLKSNSLENDIKRFIEKKEPLPVCSYCYGCVGKTCYHEQIARKKFISDFKVDYCLDDLDRTFLEEINKKDRNGFQSLKTIRKSTIIYRKKRS